MQKVSALVAEEYTTFLTWLGLPAHLHRFLHIISFKQTSTNSQGLSSQCENNQGSNCHTQGLSCGSCGRTSRGNCSRGERDHHLTITINNKIEHIQEFLFLTGGKGQREISKGKSSGGKKNQGDEFAKVEPLFSFILELSMRSIMLQEDTEGERRVWDNRSCEQGLEKEQPSVKEPHQERLDRESRG